MDMNQFTAPDPMNAFSLVVVRILMIISALIVILGGFILYHISMGTLNDWDFAFHTDFIDHLTESGNSFWLTLFLSFPTFGFLVGFIFFAWLEKKIRMES